jgi:signal transduction histidine kinase
MAEAREDRFEAVVGSAVPATRGRALVSFAEDIERSLLRAGCPDCEARRLATVRLVADLVCERAIGGRPLRPEGGPLARAARFTGLPEPTFRAMVGHVALRDPRTVARPTPEAIRTQLRIAAALASLREASCWLADPERRLECVAHADGSPSADLARVARSAFSAATQTSVDARRVLVAVPVERGAVPCGMLAARSRRGEAGIATMALRAAAPLIGLMIERDALLSSAEARGADAAGAAQRALIRFGYDVHDGPAQEVAALQAEIRDFERQVAEVFAKDERAAMLRGRFQDLEARSTAVAGQIRALALSARSLAASEEPVEEVLRRELGELRVVTGVEAHLRVSGPVDESTHSQRIALLRGVQEALRNVREHSEARRVTLRVEAGEDGIEAEVEDDGRGFDVDAVREEARTAGRMGLAGVVERARLIGGECEVRSAPGGPTSVRISLPRWDPARARPSDEDSA